MSVRKAEAYIWQCPKCQFEAAAITKPLAEWTLQYHLENVHAQRPAPDAEVF